MKSIHRWLLGALTLTLSTASLIAAFGIFHTARHEAGELFDYELRTVALSLPAHLELAEVAEQPTKGYTGIADDCIVIEMWDVKGNRLFHSSSDLTLPLPAVDGFSAIKTADVRWRAFRVTQPDRIVVVAQPYSVRHDLGFKLANRTLWPLMLFVPACLLLVFFVVRRGLAPIDRLSATLHKRSVRSLSALSLAGVPEEVRPLVIALNSLLKRLEASAHAQQSFIADAAHELRTPLTALKLQLQALGSQLSGKDEESALFLRLELRVNRIIHLTQQLLLMAREDAKQATPLTQVSLRDLAERAVADCSLLAEAQGVDLGFVRIELADADQCTIIGDEAALSTLLNNLIDNAIRHTDAKGKIDVVLSREHGVIELSVVDSGCGIPEADLSRVLDRFYRGSSARGQGSGLGLAIAASVAKRHGATLTLQNREGVRGLWVRVQGFQRRGCG